MARCLSMQLVNIVNFGPNVLPSLVLVPIAWQPFWTFNHSVPHVPVRIRDVSQAWRVRARDAPKKATRASSTGFNVCRRCSRRMWSALRQS